MRPPRRHTAPRLVCLEDRVNPVTFTSVAPFNAPAAQPFRAVAHDVNRDFIPDLAVVHLNGSAVSVHLGKGDGTFQPNPAVVTTGINRATDVVFGDFDYDLNGRIDMAVSSVGASPGTGGLAFIQGGGNGKFNVPFGNSPIATNISFASIAYADFTGDGTPDLVGQDVSSGPTSTARVYANGSPLFGFPIAPGTTTTGQGGGRIAAADFDKDGKNDVAGINRGTGDFFVQYGKGDGSFSKLYADFGAGVQPLDLAVGDFNADGKPDAAVAALGPAPGLAGTVTVYLNTGSSFTRQTPFTLSGTTAGGLSAADFDLDGKLDVVVGTPANKFYLLRGNGAGGFSVDAGSPVTTTNPANAALAVDLTVDGRPDVAVVSEMGGSVQTFRSSTDFTVGSPLLPVPLVTDMSFDDANQRLVMTTLTGRVERYSPATKALPQPFAASAIFAGSDVTPNGQFVYAADLNSSALVKVNLSTGAATSLPYTQATGNPIGWQGLWRDVSIGADGKALVTSPYIRTGTGNDGYVDLLDFNTASDTYSKRADDAKAIWISYLARSADRNTMLVTQRDIGTYNIQPGGRVSVLNRGTNTFTHRVGYEYLNMFSAVNKDGSLLSIQGMVFDKSFNMTERLANFGRMAFDPTKPVAYGIDATADQIVAIDTTTYAEKYRLPIGEDVYPQSEQFEVSPVVSGNGKWLFVKTPSGVRQIDLPQTGGTPATLSLSTPFPTFLPAGTPGQLTITVKDALGATLTGYTGTVTFTSSDASAGLPASYTFTAADQGSKTFTLALNTVGTQSLTVRDAAANLTTTQAGILVNAAGFVPSIPFGDTARLEDVVYDPTRNRVYAAVDGAIQRFDVATQALLAPLRVGTRLGGFDITPDGRYLYAPETGFTLFQQMVRRIDLETGAQTRIVYGPGNGVEAGYALWDVAVVGKYVLGVGDGALLRIDRDTNAVTAPDGVAVAFSATMISRSADNQYAVFNDMDVINQRQLFSAPTDKVTGKGGLDFITYEDVLAANRNGTLFATSRHALTVFDRSLAKVAAAPNLTSGNAVVFHPAADRMFVVTDFGNTLEGYDTGTWAKVLAAPFAGFGFGSAWSNYGFMALSTDARFLFTTEFGKVRQTVLIANQSKYVVGLPTTATAGTPTTVTITARDANGLLLPGYVGTVQLATDDPLATGLPTSVTFSPADNGVKTFSVTFRSAGVRTVTATDPTKLFGVSTGSTTVVAGAATSLTVNEFPTPTVAGAAGFVRVTARDQFGNAATGYVGTVQFASTDGNATLPAAYTFAAADGGTKQFAVTFRTAGTHNLAAGDGTLSDAQMGIVVNPGAASKLDVSGIPTAVVADQLISITVTARDDFGNLTPGYTGPVSVASSDALAVLPPATPMAGGTVGLDVRLRTAGLKSVVVTGAGLAPPAGVPTVTVSAAAAAKLVLSGLPDPLLAGFARKLWVTAHDAFGNTAAVVGDVSFSSTDPQATLPAPGPLTAGTGLFTAVVLRTAGAQSVTAAVGTAAGTLGVQVTPDEAAGLFVSWPAGPVVAGVPVPLVVTAKDQFGNTATGHTGVVSFYAADPQAKLPPAGPLTAGVGTFPLELRTAGTWHATAADAKFVALNPGIVVIPAAATAVALTVPAGPVVAGATTTVTLTALDPFGNTATGFAGTASFTSTDPQAGLPAAYTFAAADKGVKAFDVVLKTAGAKSLTATASAFADTESLAVTPAGVSKLTVAGFPSSVAAGDTGFVRVTASDPWGNTVAGYTGTVRFASTDPQAELPAAYTFAAADGGTKEFPVRLKTAGVMSVSASDGTRTDAQSVTVSSGPVDVLTLTGPTAATAGASVAFTVSAADAFGNAVAAVGPVSFTSSDAAALLPTGAPFGVEFRTAGGQTLTASAAGKQATANVQIAAAAASEFRVTGLPAAADAGVAVPLSLAAFDPFGNAAAFAGPLTVTSSDPRATLPTPNAAGGTAAFAVTLVTAGPQTITVAANGLSTTLNTILQPGPLAAVVLIGLPPTLTAGSPVAVRLSATDAYDNTLTGFAGPVAFASSDPRAELPAGAALANGVADVTVRLLTAGATTLTATAGGLTATSAATVSPAAAAVLTAVGGGGQSAERNALFAGPLVVRAADPFGNPVPGVLVSFAGGGLTFPAEASATTAADGTASARPRAGTAAGATSVSATAANLPSITFPLTVTAPASPPNTPPRVTAPDGELVAGPTSPGTLVNPFTVSDAETAADQLVVTAASSNAELLPPSAVVLGGTGTNRTLSITPAAGKSGRATITLTVRDAAGATSTADVFVLVQQPVDPVPTRLGLPKEFAVGADRGGSDARLYDPNGTVRFTLTPFPGFTGGVRTAAADFNGDGVAEMVVGTGPGRATRVLVLDGVTQAELFGVDPFEPSFTGGVYVATGDVNRDGVPELVISPDEGGGPRVDIYSGAGFTKLASFFGIADPNFRGGARAAVGDVNGDGTGDLVVAAGFGGGPRVAVFDGTTLTAAEPTRVFGDFFAFEQTLRNGVFVALGDLDGDGRAEVIAGGGPGGGPRVAAFDGKAIGGNEYVPQANFFAGDDANRGGVRLAVKDLDGDLRADLVTGAGTGGGSRLTAYSGAAVGGTPTMAFDVFDGFAGGVYVC